MDRSIPSGRSDLLEGFGSQCTSRTSELHRALRVPSQDRRTTWLTDHSDSLCRQEVPRLTPPLWSAQHHAVGETSQHGGTKGAKRFNNGHLVEGRSSRSTARRRSSTTRSTRRA